MHIELSEKRYYSIGEVAKAFGVNPSLLRFWEKEFDVLQPKKNAKGTRKFSPQDIQTLQRIYHLVKERGFTLEGAKTHLQKKTQKNISSWEVIQKLQKVRAELVKIREQL